jgi:diadenosine tetraphosphate (Ap4A) HIT family hydrolase
MSTCELCATAGGEVLFADPLLRVIAVDDVLHPAFCRVIWQGHVREMTDLVPQDRHRLMAAVFATERALRDALPVAKINLASLGNVTPHLHWHVIARFPDDPHFPAPIWATARHARAAPVPKDWRTVVGAALALALSAPAV